MNISTLLVILLALALGGLAVSVSRSTEPYPAGPTVIAKAPPAEDDHSMVCAPCLGPHYDMMSGQIRFGLSYGPGIEF